MDKQNMEYPHNEILFDQKKILIYATKWMNLEKMLWKKPDTKDHTFYDYVFMTVQTRQIYRDRKYISSCQGMGMKWTGMYRVCFGDD